jgi:hypothetical protein
MMANSLRIKNAEKEESNYQTDKYSMEIGNLIYPTAKENTIVMKAQLLMVSGKKEYIKVEILIFILILVQRI